MTMVKKKKLWLIIFILLLCSFYLKRSFQKSSAINTETHSFNRIISLAPSITETLFVLGLGDKVAGVTPDCNFPEEARLIKRIGGYFDPNYEAIISLQPDLIILLPDHHIQKREFKKLGLKTLAVDQGRINEIIKSISVLGRIGNKQELATKIVDDIQKRINVVKRKNAGFKKLKVLISVGRTDNFDSLRDIYISGNKGFINEMNLVAGGINAYQGNIPFPKVSSESIIRMNPDIIIELIPSSIQGDKIKKMIYLGWNTLSGVSAIKNNNIFILNQNFVLIPGPRFILTLEKFGQIIRTAGTKIDE